ncbi:MAG: transporter substrate-binding domain-containing protein [Bacteroidota bacterium]
MNRRKITYTGAWLLLGVLLGCRPAPPPAAVEETEPEIPEPVVFDLQQIQERGEIIALLDNSSTSYFLYKGQPMGYEYELLCLLAKELGVKLRLEIVSDLKDAFIKLNAGEGDIVAHNLTVTRDRKQWIAFTDYHHMVRQVLIQRKPRNWRQLKKHQIDARLIRNQIELIGKEVYVRRNSSYAERLHNLSDEIGGDIVMVEGDEDWDTEAMIRMVADGDIALTVADEDIAKVNATYFPELDIETAVSFPQQIAWGIRKNAPELQTHINTWLAFEKRKPDFHVIYNKYFRSEKAQLNRVRSDFFSGQQENGKLSPYDEILVEAVDSLLPDWDWRMVAAQMYQESKFNPRAESWVGAQGLMQLVSETGRYHGATNLFNPRQNIWAGVAHIRWLEGIFESKVSDPEERKKFVLASYNVGQGHIYDARKLTQKYGGNPEVWDEVEEYLLLKSKSQYFRDPVVTNGYCRCTEPVKYVEEIYTRYERYQQLLPEGDSIQGPDTLIAVLR